MSGIADQSPRPARDLLPTGTVTFLVTDIEGSTALWERHPDEMRVALDQHDTLLYRVIADHHGQVFKTVGDGFHVVFPRAIDGVLATLAAQRALRLTAWPPVARLRVRMALYSGDAELHGDDYIGPTLNRIARLVAIASGGQVLVSGTTVRLIQDPLPDDVSLLDLGDYRLRDVTRPERIFQLVSEDLPADFPPLALDARRHSLPVQRTPLINRERELATARQLLLDDDVALVTMTGAGGTGKSRLALQVVAELADRFEHGVFFVDLTRIGESALVASVIAQVLGVHEVAGRPLTERLAEYLQDRSLLLLLDNFEHVLAATPLVSELLARCSALKLLVTSRAALRVRGEHELPVPPLELPDLTRPLSEADLRRYPAVALFLERSVAIRPDLASTGQSAETAARICARLDGLPLAIELAAARVKLLPPEAMLARLVGAGQTPNSERAEQASSLQLLTVGPRDLPARQQTLRGTIAWSYDLLAPAAQTMFRRLAVFVAGCTLDAAEAVCGPSASPIPGSQPASPDTLGALASLVDNSLVEQREAANEPRFWMLDTIREFGLERLQANGEATTQRRRHAEHFLHVAEEGERGLRGDRQPDWLAQLDHEMANLRAALSWSLTPTGDAEVGLRLAGALGLFWFMRSYLSEGLGWLDRALADGEHAPSAARAKALVAAGSLARFRGEMARAAALLEAGAAIYRDLSDVQGVAWALSHLGLVVQWQGSRERGEAILVEATDLSRQSGDTWNLARSLLNRGSAAIVRHDFQYATELLEEGLELFRLRGDTWGTGRVLGHLGKAAHLQGDFTRAFDCCQEALALSRAITDTWAVGLALNGLANVALAQNDAPRAAALFAEDLTVQRDLGYKIGVAESLRGMALAATVQSQDARAARLVGAAEAILEGTGAVMPPAGPRGYERGVADLRARLGEEAFRAAWSLGRTTSLEQAVAATLEDSTA